MNNLGNKRKTARGFELIEFKDANGFKCSLQQSSAIRESPHGPGSSCVWLGGDIDRMHLDRDGVRELIDHLNKWLETGRL